MIRPAALLLLVSLIALPARLAAADDDSGALAPTEITCDHFEGVSSDTEMTTKLTGNVVVTGTNLRITCDRLEVVSYRSGPKQDLLTHRNRFKSLVAVGHVRIIQGDREATCGRAVVLPGENRITLTDNPVVVDRKYDVTYYGDSLELLRGERRVHGEHVRFVAPPLKDLGFDKDQTLTQPAPSK